MKNKVSGRCGSSFIPTFMKTRGVIYLRDRSVLRWETKRENSEVHGSALGAYIQKPKVQETGP